MFPSRCHKFILALDIQWSTWLVLVIFLAYKSSESLLQPTIRLYIYNITFQSERLVNESVHWRENQLPHQFLTSSSKSIKNVSLKSGGLYQVRWTDMLQVSETGLRDESQTDVQNKAAENLLLYRILLNAPGIFLSFVWGQLSDKPKVGRKPPMLLPAWGAVLACVLFSTAVYLQNEYKLLLTQILSIIFGGAAVYGVLGKSTVFTMACNSYIADVSKKHERTVYLGRLLGMNFFGLFFGSLLVGVTSTFGGISCALIIVVIGNAFIIAVVVFLLSDSHPLEQDAEEEDGKGHLLISKEEESSEMLTEYTKINEESTISYVKNKNDVTEEKEVSLCGYLRFIQCKGKDRSLLVFLLFSTFINQLCKAGEQDVLLLFLKNVRIPWSDEMYGYYLAVYYGCMGLNLVVTLPIIQALFQLRDSSLIMIGLAMKAIRLILTTFWKNDVVIVFVAAVIGSFAGFISSSLRSYTSKLTNPADTGKTFALVSAMEALSNLLGPSLFILSYTSIGSISLVIDAILHLSLIIYFAKINLLKEDDH